MLVSTHANNVLAEFGSVIPENLLSFEDVKRAFVRVRALELQKLGISDTDKTVEFDTLNVAAREGDLPEKFGTGILPAFAEWRPTNVENSAEKVEIVPIEQIPALEGTRSVAFYGSNPMRYKLAFDAWQNGTIYLAFDAIEDFTDFLGATEAPFPPNFLIMLEIRTAIECIGIIELKLAMKMPEEFSVNFDGITKALGRLEQRLAVKLADWMEQFRIWRNKDMSETPRLRKTFDEIYARDFNNVTGNRAGDWDG